MSDLQTLLTDLHVNGIKLSLEEERLRISAPPGILNEARRAQLAHHKTDLILLLEKQAMQQIPPTPRTGKEPLSSAQQRLWFLQQVEDNSAYNMPAMLHLQGDLQVTVLQQALNAVAARHEALRTTFIEEKGELYQRIAAPTPVPLPVITLTPPPYGSQEEAALRLAEAELHQSFDLAQGPLLRVLLIRVAATPDAPAQTPEHYLVINMHHIISDGVSIGLLIEEFAALYSAGMRGETAKLPILPVQYADYAVWQQRWRQSKRLEQQAAYWQAKLHGAPPLLELPTDRPRPAEQSYRGKTIKFTLDRESTRQINRFSQQHKATPFMTLLSAFGLLLHRYSSQSEILIGTPIAGRSQPEVERLIGLFINTLVMRISLTAKQTVTALVEQVRQTALDAYAHQDLPFERLIDLLQLQRNRSYNPVFQVLFAMQPTDEAQLRLPGLTVTPLVLETNMAKFDLSLLIGENAQGFQGELEYNSDLFDAATAQRMVTHFQNLVRAMVEQPTAPVATLPMLAPAERRQLLVDWNATALSYPDTTCLHELFEVQAARTPDKIALTVAEEQEARRLGDKETGRLGDWETGRQEASLRARAQASPLPFSPSSCLTYRELNARANQVAHQLQQLGVQPDDLVGLCVERSALLLVALLGILKAGAAYVPLDPAFPQARLRLMIEDAAPAVLISETRFAANFAGDFAGETMPQLYLDGDWAQIAQQPTHNPTSAVGPANLAYVIYTSGSTGKPKGVELRHSSVVNFLSAMRQTPGLCAEDRLLAVTTISFDIAVLELYLPLTVGATVLLASQTTSADPDQLLALMPQATVMQATPATWRMLLLAGWSGQPGLRILVGGEALPVPLAEQLLSRGHEVWNLYGPTETTVWSSCHKVEAAAIGADDSGVVTIGRPIGNTEFYILDANRQPVPVGVPGELTIGGAGLARGYRNLPVLTEEKFVANPFGAPGDRLYCTGDLARYRPDGTVDYLGRIDNQVKIRGFRIELGEIESVLMHHPQIRQAVVVARTHDNGEKQLIAYLTSDTEITPSPPHPLTLSALRDYLKPKLPDYMLPATFVTLDALPLTPNGKVDRRALQQMPTGEPVAATPYLPPTTPTEETLVAIWAEVLKLEPGRVGIEHNFFDLGGHSLLAIQVLSRVRTTFQVELPIRDLMDNPTIAGMAAVLQPLQQLAALFQPMPAEFHAERESIEL